MIVRPWEILPRLQRNIAVMCHIVYKDVQMLVFASVQISRMIKVEILSIMCLVLLRGPSVNCNGKESVEWFCLAFKETLVIVNAERLLLLVFHFLCFFFCQGYGNITYVPPIIDRPFFIFQHDTVILAALN